MSYPTNVQTGIRDYMNQIKRIRIAQASPSSQEDLQNWKYSASNTKKHQADQVATKILKTRVLNGQGMHPRRFCRRWFGLEAVNQYGQRCYTESYISILESEHGYREKCINLIARVLKIKANTIHRWGKGVEFDKISPDKRQQYEMYLGYVDTLRVLATSLGGLDERLLLRLLDREQ
ncbi:hypothetical protein [Moorena sp. SIO2C4]|uniref:hypothetical protein n=1 Tax=Moorena sp. SIO2C4 TaxID=2607824 RepID=UPI00257F0723|nr:hypothetical protein [Moorena sp. SIO2C4]